MRFKQFSVLITTLLTLLVFSNVKAESEDWSKLPEKKITQQGHYMTPQQAFEYMSNNGDKALFIDVRTRAEVNFVGMTTVADANIPYMKMNEWYAWNEKKGGFKMEVNSDFAVNVEKRLTEKQLSKNDPVILICRSGSRSSKAADLLAGLGYTRVYSIPEGFEGDKSKSGEFKGQRIVNGWKNANLPWSYKLAKNKMYSTAE